MTARLRAYPRQRAVTPPDSLDYALRDRRFDPPDERPTVTATERMWWKSTNTLAYPAGTQVPEEALELLVGEAEHLRLMRGDPGDSSKPKRRNSGRKPAGGRS